MGRSRSRDRDRKKEKKEKGDKDRDRDRDRKKDKKEPEPPPPEPEPPRPQRQRSPSFQYRRWRFDSPPKEEEYQRDAMLTGNPLGLGGVAAALQGGLGGSGVSPLQLAADTKASRELYVGNLPAGITTQQLVQFLNQVATAVKVNSLPGEPILGATMGGGGLFAFVEFRTAEEAANGLRLNGVELLGSQLKVGRPKGYTGAEGGMQSLLSLPAPTQTGGDAPSLAAMMAQAGALKPGAPGGPGGPGGGSNVVSAIDHRLCLINIPTFVGEDRIKELLITFGQLKFFAMQKDQDGKSVGVAFFEYNDMMTQQQARAALEGLELGAKKLSVKRPEEVIELGLVSRVQKLGDRVVPSKVLYLKNLVQADELRDDSMYLEICTDVRLEAEKFGPLVSMDIPRPRGCTVTNHHTTSGLQAITSGMLALEYTGAIPQAGDKVVPKDKAPDKEVDNTGAIVLHGSEKKKPMFQGLQLAVPGSFPNLNQGDDTDVPGLGFAFVEFATIEGASRAKKGLHGRQFGENEVIAEYFSEVRFSRRDLKDPKPNTEEPSLDPEAQLARMQAQEASRPAQTLEEAPVMVE